MKWIKKMFFFVVFVAAVALLILLIRNEGDIPAVIDTIKGFLGK